MAIFEINNGLSTKEFELSIAENREEYYLTVCAYGEFYDKFFSDENAVREYLKTEWKFTEEQLHQIFNLAVKNCEQTAPNLIDENYGRDMTIDIDEQMHEQQERDAEYAEAYAEWAESCYPY